MDSRRFVLSGIAGILLAGATIWAADKSADAIMSTPPVYIPDLSHANQPLPDGVLAWDQTTKSADVPDGQSLAQFVFNFTNVATRANATNLINVTQSARVVTMTNFGYWPKKVSVVTNFTSITNSIWITNSVTSDKVTILAVRPSCGCTTAQLPSMPWTLEPGTNGQIRLTVNVQGKTGVLYKSVNVSTDKGNQTLMLRINMLAPVIPTLTPAERARDIDLAKINRQAVFQSDCAKCHVRNVAGKYGQPLYQSVCAICHDMPGRASFVPGLRAIKTATNQQFWYTWVTYGKPGSLMPAFAKAQGGPLTDIQVASLASYLDYTIPSHAPAAASTNAPAK